MIVAGLGCKSGASANEIVGAIRAALKAHGLDAAQLGLAATADIKRDEVGLKQATNQLGVPLMLLDDARLEAVAGRCLTRSETSLKQTGLPSLSEAAALVAAGPGGRLLGPRLIHGNVTCALGETAPGGRP